MQLFLTSLFHLPICLTIPSILTNVPFLYLNSLIVYTVTLTVPTKSFSHTVVFQLIQAATKAQWVREYCEEWHEFNLSLLSESKDRNKSAHNYWSPIAEASQQTFQRRFNVVFKLIWRRDVAQCQINVETSVCMSTLKFTT